MQQEERHQKILDILHQENYVKTMNLSERLETTRQTIYADIDALDKAGKLKKVRGGAIVNQAVQETNIALRKVQFKKDKEAIGKLAATCIDEGDSLFLDVSTAITEMIPYLKEFHDLTIITTSIDVAYHLGNQENIKLIVLGGEVRPHDMAVTGVEAFEKAKSIYVDKAFLGLGGINQGIGFTDFHHSDSLIKAQMTKNARQSFALFDKSKVGKVALYKFAELTDIDTLISYNIDQEVFLQVIDEAGIQYLNAANPADQGVDVI